MASRLGNSIVNSRFAHFALFAVLACLFSILSWWPHANSRLYVLAWAGTAILYPYALAWTRSRIGFWKGLLTLLALLEVAQILAFVGYIARMHGLSHCDYVTVHLFPSDLIESAVLALACYSAGSLAAWIAIKRLAPQPETETEISA